MHNACKYNKTRLYAHTGILLLFLLSICNAHANSFPNLLKQSGLELGGWINGGATYNANNPADGFNGAVTFADRANRFQLNQLNIFLQRNVESEGTKWDLGGRFDFLFGTDAIYTQAFQYFRLGYGSALAWVLAVILILFTFIQIWYSRRWVYYEGE